jgi:hypothetical protein
LNLALKRIYNNKSELLLVLERPDIPLHNNGAENAIREYVKKRKISGGTRSDTGRQMPRHIYKPEENLPQIGRIVLAISQRSNRKYRSYSRPVRADSTADFESWIIDTCIISQR